MSCHKSTSYITPYTPPSTPHQNNRRCMSLLKNPVSISIGAGSIALIDGDDMAMVIPIPIFITMLLLPRGSPCPQLLLLSASDCRRRASALR